MADFSRYDDCSRCGSHLHNTNVRILSLKTCGGIKLNFYTSIQECPTLWRLYEYLADEEQAHTLRTREEKRNRSLGEGGEGYIAVDEWCYNCGCCGHWGDVSPLFCLLFAFAKSPSRTAKTYRTEKIFLRNPPLSAHTIHSQDPFLTPGFHD